MGYHGRIFCTQKEGCSIAKPWMIRKPNCQKCLWNNRRECGKDFCIFPRCPYQLKPTSKPV
nr:MAG TPA: hypothetical protein [Caudoviricetes sp.]